MSAEGTPETREDNTRSAPDEAASSSETASQETQPRTDDTGSDDLRQRIEALERALKESEDRYVRLCAEFENTRKRLAREKDEFVKFAGAQILRDFIEILDDLERTTASATDARVDEGFLKGIEMVMARIYELLKRHGVVPIKTFGEKFDPHRHEILMQQETTDHEEGDILEEFQKGYMMGDRVLRTAKVKVAVRPSPEKQDVLKEGSQRQTPEAHDNPEDPR